MKVTVWLPIRTVSEMNARENWRTRAKRAKMQRGMARCMCARYGAVLLRAIRLVRVSPRELDDDNLRASFKHIRDGVADAFGVDDRHLLWEYDQEKGEPKQYAVRIELIGR